jgi:hypothetical protein
VDDVLQVAGALSILIPFILLQAGRVGARSLAYLVPNFVGSGLLAVLAALDRDWGFLLLEVVWALVAGFGILTVLFRSSKAVPADRNS